MRISDWSSDVCSSDLPVARRILGGKDRKLGTGAGADSDHFGGIVTRVIGIDLDFRLLADMHVAKLGFLEIGFDPRSEERRVGKECVSTCRSRWSPDH